MRRAQSCGAALALARADGCGDGGDDDDDDASAPIQQCSRPPSSLWGDATDMLMNPDCGPDCGNCPGMSAEQLGVSLGGRSTTIGEGELVPHGACFVLDHTLLLRGSALLPLSLIHI